MSVGRYMAFSPSPSTAPHSPHISGLRTATAIVEQEKYLSELLAERNKLGPFMPVLPHCYRLLNQEILRVTTLLGNASILDQGAIEHGRPLSTGGFFSNGAAADLNGWTSTFQPERLGMMQSPSGHGWLGSPGGSSGIIIKKTIRVDIPVDKYPNYNFVGRLLGPRGNSLKRVEASTECRVLIRGRGSIKDPNREEMMRGKPGYEHLNEPLHILVDAELPMEIIDSRLIQARDILEELLKPVDESQDLIKKQQLRELAMLNGTLRDDSSQMSGSLSPFHNSLGMKRAKTRG
ncbi:KH domain-containing protein At5g56140-like isoform X2 [Dendrobium catenatum]|uniref:KH domain-containing protein At5g56140-like isoform X2 n=1 Tax=Dendrobium catenatum TaxID=906689 RepID=UPI0009F3D381|nr:KH domain-containing protein At5g56140-like isoform X2 [Dendrobium catenatum]